MWTEYLSVGNAKVGMRVNQTATATLSTRYFHTDHLGSVSVISDENGNVLERLSYDAWGKRRFANGTDDPSGSITSQTTRGFTGEEELSVAGLVHLNGRVYDPLLARFTSADPTVTDPLNPQGWNRYSYVGNDPLAFTDPNGFSWLSGFFHSVGKFFTSVGNFIKNNSIARAIFQLGTTILLNAVLPGLGLVGGALAFASAAGGAAITVGITGGNLGQVLKAGLIAGVTAFAFFEVGSATNAIAGVNPDAPHIQPAFGTDAYAFNVAGHALVGCASSAASGGSCESGALSGAVTAGTGPFINNQNQVASLVQNTVLGGLASVAGGGKFANGAITGAFGYLFNAAGGKSFGHVVGYAIGGVGGIETGLGDVLIAYTLGQALGEVFSRVEDFIYASAISSWGNPDTLTDHFNRHGADFGATSEADYAHQASAFLGQAFDSGLPTKIDANGNIRVYDPSTNTFGAYNPDGTTRTFYKPDPATHGLPTNIDYWNAQPGK